MFLKALHNAVNTYNGGSIDEDEKLAWLKMSSEARADAAMETAGLKSEDWNTTHAIRTVIFVCGRDNVAHARTLYEMMLVEEAFSAWQDCESKATPTKPAAKQRPARMRAKK